MFYCPKDGGFYGSLDVIEDGIELTDDEYLKLIRGQLGYGFKVEESGAVSVVEVPPEAVI
ncbi:hypothetical protein [Pseudomonas sp. Irchel 3E20]|uniref:hypothetical protein n=1 Tax=Pseudomonas sp. Irchel 3E20 TaxID=2008983 RepID=UPI000BA48DE2|nr:hypothetical protein [Pseudomonas sp. Irchel 3E20]